MDEEVVAQTLLELERKLIELEDTLHAIASGGGDQTRPAASQARPAASEAELAPPRASAPSHGRIVDETIEFPPEASQRAPQPPPEKPAAASELDPPTRRPSLSPPRPAPQPGRPPDPAELLRFRERLERAARDLTHDYDELLGRLSYAAMSTSPPRTISFVRGVPSLDIIDVEGLREAAVR